MFDVVTIGAATRDIFLRSKEFKPKRDPSTPAPTELILPLGEKVTVDELIFETGGGATNAAVTFSRQGLRTTCICRVGEDPGGRAIVESIEAEGVNTDHIIRDKENYTGYSIIPVASSGERVILVYRGASSHFDERIIPKAKINTKWNFITSLAGRVDLLDKILTWSDNQKINSAVIPGSAELEKGAKALAPMFARAEVVIMNRQEAAELTGIDVAKKEKIVHKMCLLTKGVGVITDGPYGATACDRQFIYHIGTHGNKAVERTGAGDAFASGFVAGLIKFGSIEGALELAADNGSSVINYFGAKKGILRSGERPFKERVKITKRRIK